MGLIYVSDPLEVSFEFSTAQTSYVIIVITDLEKMQLFYSSKDTQKALEKLLDKEGISDEVKKAIIKSIGFTILGKMPKSNSHADLSRYLPGVDLVVKHPVTGESNKLWNIVINLNDHYRWTREAIADWIESVADTKDIAFPTPLEVNDEVGEVSKFTKVVKIQRILSS